MQIYIKNPQNNEKLNFSVRPYVSVTPVLLIGTTCGLTFKVAPNKIGLSLSNILEPLHSGLSHIRLCPT